MLLRYLSRRLAPKAYSRSRRRRPKGYALPSVIVLSLVLVVSSTALIVRAASERASGGQDTQIVLARNNAENGITEIVRQLNGPYSYLAGLNRESWADNARTESDRQAAYYKSIKSQLEAIKRSGIANNPNVKLGCGTDADGNPAVYTETEIDTLIAQLEATITQLEGNLPAWITGQNENDRTIQQDNGNTVQLVNYAVNDEAAPTQATIDVRGNLGIGAEAEIEQTFNLEPRTISPNNSSFLINAGLLFKAGGVSDIGGLDVETARQDIDGVPVYDFCLANATCIDCASVDDIERKKNNLAQIAGLLTALGGNYDFPRNAIAAINPDNNQLVKDGEGPALEFITVDLTSNQNGQGNQKDVGSQAVSNRTLNKKADPPNSGGGNSGGGNSGGGNSGGGNSGGGNSGGGNSGGGNSGGGNSGGGNSGGGNSGGGNSGGGNSGGGNSGGGNSGGGNSGGGNSGGGNSGGGNSGGGNSGGGNSGGGNSGGGNSGGGNSGGGNNKVTTFTVEGDNRTVIRIKANGGEIPQFKIERNNPETPLPIVIIEGSGTLTLNGNDSLGDAFIIAPDVDLDVRGGGGENPPIVRGSLWVNSIVNKSNAGGNGTVFDSKAEILVDPEMRTILDQFGLAQLAVNTGGGNTPLVTYRLVSSDNNRWTLN
ncbi:hypothetical protein VZG28_01770 [Synechococcus elongatus IITB4]|uniref:hypothetical protein n=1 Tax=Synechococcus elongatus TaxID=32046 RepID=UPI0030D464BE